jgi:ABC-type phosphate transport system auxiliary subunit
MNTTLSQCSGCPLTMDRSWETKYLDAQKQIKLLDARVSDLNSQLTAADLEKGKLHNLINKHNEKIDSLLFSSKKLEKDYASLQERYSDLENSARQVVQVQFPEGLWPSVSSLLLSSQPRSNRLLCKKPRLCKRVFVC